MSKIKKLYGNKPMGYVKFGTGYLNPTLNHRKPTSPHYYGEFEDGSGKIYSMGGWKMPNGAISVNLSLIVPKECLRDDDEQEDEEA